MSPNETPKNKINNFKVNKKTLKKDSLIKVPIILLRLPYILHKINMRLY